MHTTRLAVRTPSGRRVEVWRSEPQARAAAGPVVVLSPGFARTMAELGCPALFLSTNGATVYRFDPLDHVGLSDGTIEHYTLTATLRSFEAVLSLVAEREGRPIVLVASGVSARPALRAAASSPAVERLISVLGVVSVRDTITATFGQELLELPRRALPARITVGEHELSPAAVLDDDVAHGWLSFEGALADIDALDIPVVAVCAGQDRFAEQAYGRSARHRLVRVDAGAGFEALGAMTAAACGVDRPVLPALAELERVLVDERAMAHQPRAS